MHFIPSALGIKLSAPEGFRFRHHFSPYQEKAGKSRKDGNLLKEATSVGPMIARRHSSCVTVSVPLS